MFPVVQLSPLEALGSNLIVDLSDNEMKSAVSKVRKHPSKRRRNLERMAGVELGLIHHKRGGGFQKGK
jgi:hypothetical protein